MLDVEPNSANWFTTTVNRMFMIVSSLCIIETAQCRQRMYRSFRSVIPLNSLALLRVVELLRRVTNRLEILRLCKEHAAFVEKGFSIYGPADELGWGRRHNSDSLRLWKKLQLLFNRVVFDVSQEAILVTAWNACDNVRLCVRRWEHSSAMFCIFWS